MTDDQLRLKAKFTSADGNGDGSLDEGEFKALVYPHQHDNMIHHLVNDQLASFDKNEDGEISRREFLGNKLQVYVRSPHRPIPDPLYEATPLSWVDDHTLALHDNHTSIAAHFNPERLPEDELPDWVGDEKAKFDYKLDSDHNGKLDREEIRQWLVPDDATLFDIEARHLFYNADKNKASSLCAIHTMWPLLTVL